jgi:hypothetical protein
MLQFKIVIILKYTTVFIIRCELFFKMLHITKRTKVYFILFLAYIPHFEKNRVGL